jgi:hypothetical protein
VIVVFLLKNLAVLVLLLVTAACAGTLALGAREGLALRSALGLALCAHACFFLGVVGQLRAGPIVALMVVIVCGGAAAASAAGLSAPEAGAAPLLFTPLFLLALLPPIAFDETLYHLPFVRAFARAGALRFLPDVRFPVFPVLHELLAVPPYLLAGDVGTHLVALAEVIVLAALLIEWARRYDVRAGWLAAALFLGSPLIIHLSTVLHVEMALALFIAAGFYALDRERYALAGVFLGSACSVKYLGFYFALAALAIAAVRRRAAVFALGCALSALPMTAWIYLSTRNPVFPFLGKSIWLPDPWPDVGWTGRLVRMLRVTWDVTFARQRVGWQPPVTPLLALLLVLIAAAAVRDVRARLLLLLAAIYVAIFSYLPQDARYLVPLLPLISVAGAVIAIRRWPRIATAMTMIAAVPGFAYAAYRIGLQGFPSTRNTEWLESRLPEYRALRHAGEEPVYACGAERLKGLAGGRFLGDSFGPYSYNRLPDNTSAIAERMRQWNVRYYLLAKRGCKPPRADGGMRLVYEDADAQLWQVRM